MFGSKEDKKVAQTATGIIEIIDFNASELGYRAVNGLPREFASKEMFLVAIMGLVFATCEMLGTDNRKTLYLVLQTLFPDDMSVAMETIDRAAQYSKAESIFDSVRTYLASLAGAPSPEGHRDMLFLVQYMRPEKIESRHAKIDPISSDANAFEVDYDAEPDPELDCWDEYTSMCQQSVGGVSVAEVSAADKLLNLISSERTMTWEEWYQEFKKAAADGNSQLRISENGTSFLDFMDHEPLKRAHRDGVDPELLGAGFAAQFDMSEVLSRGAK